TKRDDIAGEVRRQYATHQRRRQGQEAEDRHAQVPEGRQQDEEYPDRRADRKEQQAALGGLALGILAQHLGVVPERELNSLQAIIDVGHDSVEGTSLHVGAHVDATRGVVTINNALSWRDTHRGHIAQTYMPAV